MDELASIKAIVEDLDAEGVTDTKLLGDIVHPEDSTQDWLTLNDYYKWYYSIAEVVQPKRIGEIGMRRGYSSLSMIKGTMAAGTTIAEIELFTWDNQCYVYNSLSYCWDYFQRTMPELPYFGREVDTRKIDDLEVTGLDLFHVDGDHYFEGCLHDMQLAAKALKPGGIMLVDDIIAGLGSVKPAADLWCRENGIEPLFVPHLRGLYLIRMPTQ